MTLSKTSGRLSSGLVVLPRRPLEDPQSIPDSFEFSLQVGGFIKTRWPAGVDAAEVIGPAVLPDMLV